MAGINLHVGVGELGFQLLVASLVGYHHRGWIELTGLLGKFLHAVVGSQRVSLVKVRVLPYDIKGLRAY